MHSEVVGDAAGKIEWSQIREDLGRPTGKFGLILQSVEKKQIFLKGVGKELSSSMGKYVL